MDGEGVPVKWQSPRRRRRGTCGPVPAGGKASAVADAVGVVFVDCCVAAAEVGGGGAVLAMCWRALALVMLK